MKVELDPDVLKLLQEGHGGWNDLMFEVECTYQCQVSIDHHLDSVRATNKWPLIQLIDKANECILL